METLRKELEARQARKTDAVVLFSNLRYVDGSIIVKDDEGTTRSFSTTRTGLKQILRNAEIPADFFVEKMTTAEQETIFNRLVSMDDGRRMLRMDCTEKRNLIYGCVSENYKTIDNISVMDVVETSSIPFVLLNGSSQFYDHSKFRFTPSCYTNNIHRGAHIPAVEIINSENGLGSFKVVCCVFTILCTNGMVIQLPNSETFKTKFYHKGNKNVQFPDLNQVLNFAETMVVKMEKAEKIYVSADEKVRIINKALGAGLSHNTITGVIETANAHYHNGRTLAEICGSFTQFAQSYVDDETIKRTAIEEFAGSLLLKAA